MRPLAFLRQGVLRNQAAHDTAALYFSHLLAAGIGFGVSLIVARELGPGAFGIITAYTAIIDVLAGFTDFGLGTGLIKFTSPFLKSKAPRKAAAYFRAALYAEIIAGLLVLLIGLSCSGLLTRLIGRDLPHHAVVLAVISAAITSTAAYVAPALAAHKRFKRNAIVSASISIARLLVILGLLWTSSLSLYNVLYGYVVLATLAAALGFAVTPRDYLQKVPLGAVRRAAMDIFKFSGWLTLTFFVTSVMGRLDFFFLYRIRGAHEAGVYSAAIQLSLGFTILIGAITTVLTPHVSERTTYPEKIDFLKRAMPVVTLIGVLLAASSLVFPSVLSLLFGDKYLAAGGPLIVLIVHLALNVVLIPISLMLIPLGKVRIGTFISVLQLAVAFVVYPLLIRQYGSIGAALTVLLNTCVGATIYVLVLRYLLGKEKISESRVYA